MEGQEEGNSIKEIVAVIDADFIPYYVCHNKKDEEPKKLVDCKRLANEFIHNICVATEASYYVSFLTVGKCFRYGINPDYKANRKYTDEVKYLGETKEHIMLNHNSYYDLNKYEADDLVVSFVKQNPQFNCVAVSPDKDVFNSVEVAFNPRQMKWVNNNKADIERYFWKSMITGDTIDGIKGIPGKGEAYFKALMSNGDGYSYPNLHTQIFDAYINHFGEYTGIQEFTKNYLSLKLVDNVQLGEVKLNKINKELW